MRNKNNTHRVHMFSTKRRPCHFNSLRMTKYISHIIHSCCATHMCMEHIHTPGPVMSRGNTNTVPRPYVNLVATPPKGRPTGRPPMKEAASYEGCTCWGSSFLWVVLMGPWGLRGPALNIWFQRSWSSSALGEATLRYPDHMLIW